MDIEPLLQLMIEKDGSDLFISEGRAPGLKAQGKIHNVGKAALTKTQTRDMALATMEDWQKDEFLKEKELNYAIVSKKGGGRFRVNTFFQRGAVGMVLRKIPTDIPTPEDLHLPPILKELCMNKRGIIIFVGGTGTGKSTSLASLIGYRNEYGNGHIITIEDPIEFVHEHKGCIITQRELGIDTLSWENALHSTLRQAPDVILIGEIRSRETMEHAVSFAETGHLVFATLHANNANQALDRIINFFPSDRRDQLLLDLSLNLRAFVAQQLIPTIDGGRRAAIEILINTPLIGDLVKKGEVHEIKEIMSKSKELGMQTFDQALYELFNEGLVSYDEAIKHADSKNDLRLMIKLHSSSENVRGEDDGTDGLMLEETKEKDGGALF
jgi:twitching motility protein PilU